MTKHLTSDLGLGATEAPILERIKIGEETLQAVVDECLQRQKQLSGLAIDERRLMATPEAKSMALRYAFEGCALSALAFSAPEEVFGNALRECTRSAVTSKLHDPAFISWVKELRAVAFVASVEEEKATLKSTDSVLDFDIEGRVDRVMSSLI